MVVEVVVLVLVVVVVVVVGGSGGVKRTVVVVASTGCIDNCPPKVSNTTAHARRRAWRGRCIVDLLRCKQDRTNDEPACSLLSISPEHTHTHTK